MTVYKTPPVVLYHSILIVLCLMLISGVNSGLLIRESNFWRINSLISKTKLGVIRHAPPESTHIVVTVSITHIVVTVSITHIVVTVSITHIVVTVSITHIVVTVSITDN
jgi:hypothetical protein